MTFADARARLTGATLDVYEVLLNRGPQTAPDAAARLRIDPAQAAQAMAELVAIRHARESGRMKGAERVFVGLSTAQAEAAFAGKPVGDIRGPSVWIPEPKQPASGEQTSFLL